MDCSLTKKEKTALVIGILKFVTEGLMSLPGSTRMRHDASLIEDTGDITHRWAVDVTGAKVRVAVDILTMTMVCWLW